MAVSAIVFCGATAPQILYTLSVILSEAKNLLWTNAQVSTLVPDSARDSSLRYAPFENDGQKI